VLEESEQRLAVQGAYVALKGCSAGKLQFKGDFVFTDGSKQSPTSTTACKK
jgi:hypothetical protein